MTRFDHIQYVYLIGIGGIGMSGLARYFKHHGKTVAGYDKTETPLTHLLNSEGIIVNYLDDVQGIPAEITSSNADEVLVIITPAIPQANEQLKYFISRGTTLHKRSEVLGLITTDYSTLAVAGTHGKTTTSSILAHLMHHAGMPTTAFIGGIMKNYQSNVLLSEEQKWMIVEADEYDRSFLRLKPRVAAVTSMDADHLDIYGSADGMRNTYREFTQLIDREGRLLVHHDPVTLTLEHPNRITFGMNANADVTAQDIQIKAGKYHFRITGPGWTVDDIQYNQPGMHNIENALAATAMAVEAGLETSAIREGLATYEGVKRRFEYVVNANGVVYIDDYAHHPTEISACIKAARDFYPKKKITGVFQPHLFSRTMDLMDGFAESLSALDEVILLPIYPARELPIDGVDSEALLERIPVNQKSVCAKERLTDRILNADCEVLLTLGAGDIDTLVDPLKKGLETKYGLITGREKV